MQKVFSVLLECLGRGGAMRVIACVVLVALMVNLTGCAAMFHGTSDQITVQSADPEAKLYLDNVLIGKGSAVATVKRNSIHAVSAKKRGCSDSLAQTETRFDAISLLDFLIDWGLISFLVVDWGATGAAWKTDPLVYHVTPICDEPELTQNSMLPLAGGTMPRGYLPRQREQAQTMPPAAPDVRKKHSACVETDRGVICREPSKWSPN